MYLQGWRYYIVGGDSAIRDMMVDACAYEARGLKEADIIIFSGGTDIDPALYGEKLHPATQSPDKERDRIEQAVYHTGVRKRKILVGICRGAQFLNVMNGGRLWQDVDCHGGCTHPVLYRNDKNEPLIVAVTSDHHQMMIPTADAQIWATASRSKHRASDTNKVSVTKNMNADAEVVFYKNTRSLCYQPHPEWGLISDKMLFMDCMRRTMLGG